MALDEAKVVEALGETAGKLFVALGRSGIPSDLDAFGGKLDEYLGFLEDTLSLERYAALQKDFPMDQAKALVGAWRDLLGRAAGAGEEATLLITTGVRYFVTPHDAESELESRHGFGDDARVVNYVIEATGLPVASLDFATEV